MATNSLWQRYQQYFLRYDDLGFSLDISRRAFLDSLPIFMSGESPRRAESHSSMFC
jgi:hypothetical protein